MHKTSNSLQKYNDLEPDWGTRCFVLKAVSFHIAMVLRSCPFPCHDCLPIPDNVQDFLWALV